MTMSLIVGPVLVKVVGDRFGFEGAFWFQAGLLIVGTVFLLMLEVPPHEEVRERRPVVAEVREAVHHILGDSQLKTLFGLLLTGSLTVNPAVMVTLQAHVKSELGRDAGDAAIPFAMMGIGIAISSLFLIRKGDMPNKGAVFQRAMMVSAATILLIGFANSFGVVVVLSLVVGLSGGFFINMNQGLIQARTPQALMGRVMAVYTLVANGLFPVGALVLGLLATVIGTGATISLAASVSLCIVTTTYVRNTDLRRLA
jgi:predicted MFS family arabinose efflux permease